MASPRREDETLPLPLSGRRLPTVTARGGVRYVLLDEIAHGGMGAVYRARDPELERLLALKVLRPEHQNNPEMVRRFLEEARIAGQLQHPGIVPIHDFGHLADDRPFFTMKLVEGRTLGEWLGDRKSPGEDLPRFLGIFEQICQAMAYAHSRGVIHRDLKPSNVMVGAFGEVQVMDWGLAKVITPGASRQPVPEHKDRVIHGPIDQTLAGSVVGTPAYMPPEQARAQALDEQADVFGLGGILCEILTGQPPYVLPRSMATWLLNQDRDLTDAHARLDACQADAELVALTRECLAETPTSRPRDAGVVASRITAFRVRVEERLRQAEIERASAEASADAARARARAERRAGRLLTLLALGVLSFGVLAGTAGWFWHHRRQVAQQRLAMHLDHAIALAEQAEKGQGSEQALAKWSEAATSIDQARGIVESGLASAEQRHSVQEQGERIRRERDRLTRDRKFLDRLAEIRIQKDDDFEPFDTHGAYLAAFRAHGLDVERRSVAELADEIRLRPPAVIREIVAALDDWCQERRRHRRSDSRWRPLVRLAAAIDENAWRNDLRTSLLETELGVSRAEFLVLDLLAGLTRSNGICLQLIPFEISSARRRERLLELAGRADVRHLPPTSVQLLASLLREQGRYDEAVHLLRDAQRRHPGDVWVNHDLARALHQHPNPQLDEAIRFYTAARSVRPEIGHALAHALEERGRRQEAAQVFEELARLRPENPRHHNCLGMTLAKLGRIGEGMAALEKAISLAPDLSQPRFNLGLVLASQGKLPRAAASFREAIKRNPDDPDVYHQLGKVLTDLGELEEAEACFERAVRSRSQDASVFYSMGLLREKQGRSEEAMRVYRQAISLSPTHAEARTNLANLLVRARRLSEAAEHFQIAIRHRPDLEQPRWGLGMLLFAQGQFAESISHLRWLTVTTSQKSPWPFIRLAIALEQTRQPTEAFRVYQDAMKRFPTDSVLPYNLAMLYSEQNRDEEAIFWYRRAIANRPDYPEAHCNLGHKLRGQGEFAEALAMMKRGHELGEMKPDWRYPSQEWVAECEQLAAIEGKLADFVSGRQTPQNQGERILAARACMLKKLHAGSTTLLRQVFEAEPDLVRRHQQVDMTLAAAVAVLAGTGQSKDAGPLSEARRHALRLQGLTWLVGERDRCREHLRGSRAPLVTRARRVLSGWLSDERLAAVREPAGLAKLGREERQAWEEFWRSVRELAAQK